MSAPAFRVPPQVEAIASRGRIAAGVGLLALLVGGAADPAQALRSYLFGFLFWMGLPIGSLVILMIHHLSGGGWGLGIKRMLEAASRTLYWAPVLFLPVALGVGQLYPWTHAEAAADPIVSQKLAYLNVPFFLARAAFYFACWGLLAHLLSRWSLERDAHPSRAIGERLEALSGAGIVLLTLTLTFASVDWAMSLNPHWFSTIYGVIFVVGYLLTAMAVMILLVALLGDEEPLSDVISRESIHDLGKLMLAFVLLWAYVSVSQLIIMWSANLPEEITFYIRRLEGGWRFVAPLIVVGHFGVPFLLLLSRELKRNARSLALVAAGLLVMRLIDLFWLVGPDLQGHGGAAHGLAVHWLDLLAPLGIGGVFAVLFARELRGRPLLTSGDPELREMLQGIEAHV